MRVCLKCGSDRVGDDWLCPACGDIPPIIDGFRSFVSDDMVDHIGYRSEWIDALAAIEAHSFWFGARAELIAWALSRYFPGFLSLLDIGCGTGFVLSTIRDAFPAPRLAGGEILAEGLRVASTRLASAEFFRVDASAIPFRAEFDVVTAFDVVEHIVDDDAVIAAAVRAARPGGGLVFTAPQHPALWSEQDRASGHVRRYRAGALRRRLKSHGLTIVRETSFVSILLPLLFASRRLTRGNRHPDDHDPLEALQPGRFDPLLRAVMDGERALIRRGFSFPIGGSVLVVARKPGPSA